MTLSIAELATAWGRSQAAIEDVLRETDVLAERAHRLAALLQPLAPEGFCACQLTTADTSARAWRAGVFEPPPDLDKWLAEEFVRLDPLAVSLVRVPRLEDRLGLRVVLTGVARGGQVWGILLLAWPGHAEAARNSAVEALLLGTARTLALLLQQETATRERRELLDQLANAADAALVGEAANGLVHELNNALNSILLQTSIVQMRAPADLHEELAVIRSYGRQAAALLRPLQQGRQDRRQSLGRVDLNEVVREVRDTEPEGARGVRLDLAPQLRPLSATREGLKTIVRWLLHTALSRQPATAGAVAVRTRSDGERVLLAVEDKGGPVPEPTLERLFDAEEGLLVRSNQLERLASHSLLRLFGGVLQARSRPEGGVTLAVEWS